MIKTALFCAALGVAAPLPALASPWAEVGDNQLRSDMELLQASGVLNGVTTHWPLPWGAIKAALNGGALAAQPGPVRAAAQRLLRRAAAETAPGVSTSFYADVTNQTGVVRGFDGLGRGDGQAQLSVSGASGIFSGRLSVGAITQNFGSKPNKLMLDGTYGAVQLGGVRVYAGYLDHWWGPGQISTLQFSNNARPMPQVGIERASTSASSWPVLRWLGPWQLEFLVGKLDGPQIQPDVYYNAARLTFEPLPGLEIGLAKTEEFCGQGHPCAPLRDYLTNIDFSTNPNNVNGEGAFDIKYSSMLGTVPFQVYAQVMNEDYNLFKSSASSHMLGASIFLPTANNPVKFTAEITDSTATKTVFSFHDNFYGFTYTDGQYPDGMRYRGRTLGFSLDNDSTLASLQGSWTDPGGRFYEVSLHHAIIGTNHTPLGVNIVSRSPVKLNMAEARISLPWRGLKLDLAGRLQDDQPRPHRGFAAAAEIALRAPL